MIGEAAFMHYVKPHNVKAHYVRPHMRNGTYVRGYWRNGYWRDGDGDTSIDRDTGYWAGNSSGIGLSSFIDKLKNWGGLI